MVLYGANDVTVFAEEPNRSGCFAPLKAMEAETQAAHRKAAEAAEAAGQEEPQNTARRFQVQGTATRPGAVALQANNCWPSQLSRRAFQPLRRDGVEPQL